MIIEDQLSLEAFINFYGVDQEAAEEELERLLPVAETYNSVVPKPIYFFKVSEFPNLGHLFHCSKLFAFAKGGSPYKEFEISEHDVRKEYPYIQAAVYDPERKVFVAGLRFLKQKSVPFHMSAMSSLFVPTDEFITSFLPYSLEVGQTFVLQDIGSSGGNYLFSVMATLLVLNPDVRFLSGKPTIEGRIPDISKEIISAFAYDAFDPRDNTILNPCGKNLFSAAEGIDVPQLCSLGDIVQHYNEEIKGLTQQYPLLAYEKTMSVQKKRKITAQLLLYYGGALPPMFKFYSILTEEKGMICPYTSVINPMYTTKAWEFPILLDKSKISSIHKKIWDHYLEYFKDKNVHY